MKNGSIRIEENTEYSIRMPDGQVQKFAYYGEKPNGRLILLNTRYGTLTSMGASYFRKLISGKYPCSTRPYLVERPEEEYKPTPIVTDQNTTSEHKVSKEEDIETKKILKWAQRLKTLDAREEELLEKEIKVKPYLLGEWLVEWTENRFQGSISEMLGAFEKIKKLLKGTRWDVK